MVHHGEFGEVTVIIGLVINFLAFVSPFVSFRDTLTYQKNMNRIGTTLVLRFTFQDIVFAKLFLVETADEKSLRYISNLSFLRVIPECSLSVI